MRYEISEIEKGECSMAADPEFCEQYKTVSFIGIETIEDINEAIYILNVLKKEIKED